MKIKSLAIAAIALFALVAPASAGAVTLIGSGSAAAQPVLEPLFAAYTKKTKGKVKFVYTANGGNAGVKDVQSGASMFAGQARSPLPSDAGTTYVKMYLNGTCMDVNKANKATDISLQQLHDIYRGLLTSWSAIPGSGLDTTISAVGRDTNGGTYNFFLQAVLNNEAPGANVNALTSDGLVANAVKQVRTRSGTSGSPGREARPSTRSRSTASPAHRDRSRSSSTRSPGTSSWSSPPPQPRGDEIHRSGAQGPCGRSNHQQIRRGRRVQQGAEEEVETRWKRSTTQIQGRGGPTSASSSCSARWSAPWSDCFSRWSSRSSSTAGRRSPTTAASWFGPGGNVDEQLRRLSLR